MSDSVVIDVGATATRSFSPEVQLDAERVSFRQPDGSESGFLVSDLVGATLEEQGGVWRVDALTYSYPAKRGCSRGGSGATRVRWVHVVARLTSEAVARALVTALQLLATGSVAWRDPTAKPPSRRRLLAFINPRSGPGRGVDDFEVLCRPMLVDAGCDVDVIVTERAGHAAAALHAMPASELLSYSGVLAGGGDGSVHEVVQGLLSRADGAACAAALVLGHLPLGSGNGLASSLCAAAGLPYSVSNAALLVTKDARSPLDIATVFCETAPVRSGFTPNAPPPTGWGLERRFSFLSSAWGLVADADIESEFLRCLGDARTTLWGLVRIATLRRYRGTLWILPEASVNAATTAALGGRAVAGSAWPPATPSLRPFGEALTTEDGWRELRGPFACIWVTSTTHQTIGAAAAPLSSHHDGVLTVTAITGGIGRGDLLRMLLEMDDTGFSAHLAAHPGLATTLTCRAFRLEPDPVDPMRTHGHVVVDGEEVGYGAVQAEVHPSLVTVYGRLKPQT